MKFETQVELKIKDNTVIPQIVLHPEESYSESLNNLYLNPFHVTVIPQILLHPEESYSGSDVIKYE